MTKITILDGGMGRELKRMGAPFKQPEWSALALMEAPETVTQAHQSFIDAGAEVITTNTYALVPFHIGWDRFNEQGRELISLAATIAKDVAGNNVKVAGCIPPLFGSYAPDDFDGEKAPDLLKPLIEEQQDFVNVWLVETTSAIQEAQMAYDHLKNTNKPIWISFTVSEREDKNTTVRNRSGETIEDCAKALKNMKGVEAILFNCSQPEEMEDAILAAKNVLSDAMQIGAYANTFAEAQDNNEANDGLTEMRNELTPELYLEFAKKWCSDGASIIGGCCGIGPEHIEALAKEFV
ncbi:MAG: homocysteine S-methyltransferase family protein [Pseudomonadota bacterium]